MEQVPSRFEQLWSIEDVAEYLAMSRATLYGWRCRKYGPPSYGWSGVQQSGVRLPGERVA